MSEMLKTDLLSHVSNHMLDSHHKPDSKKYVVHWIDNGKSYTVKVR